MIHALLLLLPVSMERDTLTSLKRETLRVRIGSISQPQKKKNRPPFAHKKEKTKPPLKKKAADKSVTPSHESSKRKKVETKTPLEKKTEAVSHKDEMAAKNQVVEVKNEADTITRTEVVETVKTVEDKDVDSRESSGDTGTNERSFDDSPYRGEFGTPEGPKFLKRVIPEYPPLARRHGKEGVVLLKLFIDSAGNLKDVELLSGDRYGFGKAAIRAVKASRYIPAKRKGRSVDSEVVLKVRFKLN